MSLRRLNRTIKTLAEKGIPGTRYRRIEMRAFLTKKRGWLLRGWHPTKGWRNFAR